MGPIATGLGEIFMCTVEAEPDARKTDGEPYTATDLRTIQDWVIRPQLRTVPGVTEVNTIGGFEKQYHVAPDPAQLVAYGLTFRDVMAALATNNANVGAGYIEHNGEQYLVRAPGQVARRRGHPGRSWSDARRRADPRRRRRRGRRRRELRTGAATENGEEVVLGTVIHADRREQPHGVAARRREARRRSTRSLPRRRRREDGLRPHDAGRRTIATVEKNLFEGALLVIVVLFLLLGNFARGARRPRCVIPLSMLLTVTGMVREPGQRQPDEPRRDRLRPHRRRRRDHRRELPARARGGAAPARPRCSTREERFDDDSRGMRAR